MMHDQYMSTSKSDKNKDEFDFITVEIKFENKQLPTIRESMHTEDIDNANEEFDLNYERQNYENFMRQPDKTEHLDLIMVDSQLHTESQKNPDDDSESVNSYKDASLDIYTDSHFIGN